MDKNKKLILVGIGSLAVIITTTLLAFLGISYIGKTETIRNQSDKYEVITGVYKNPRNNTTINLKLEVANTHDKREYGLMDRTSLDWNSGMLFIFEEPQNLSFWMKNTLISLDIIFLDSSQKVINIHKNTIPNNTKNIYSSNNLAKYALEVNGGWSDYYSVQAGDYFEFN